MEQTEQQTEEEPDIARKPEKNSEKQKSDAQETETFNTQEQKLPA